MGLREYGKPPHNVVVVHGGPGAVGSLKPVCEELSQHCSIIEMLQTSMSIEGQMQDLKSLIEDKMESPVTLIGHSWGAMLIYMFASRYSDLVEKIILVASGSLEEKYYEDLCDNRESKLSDDERTELNYLRERFSKRDSKDMNKVFARFGALMEKLDTYEAIDIEVDDRLFNYEMFTKVWSEAHALRKSGEMYGMGKNITCKVIAIHGDHDSHPSYGIKASLEKIIDDLEFYELKKCGHSPWIEVNARDEFFDILKRYL